jgi:hypothetical protein
VFYLETEGWPRRKVPTRNEVEGLRLTCRVYTISGDEMVVSVVLKMTLKNLQNVISFLLYSSV